MITESVEAVAVIAEKLHLGRVMTAINDRTDPHDVSM
jgi:hypothetical protein